MTAACVHVKSDWMAARKGNDIGHSKTLSELKGQSNDLRRR
jgi:hypothetical protein